MRVAYTFPPAVQCHHLLQNYLACNALHIQYFFLLTQILYIAQQRDGLPDLLLVGVRPRREVRLGRRGRRQGRGGVGSVR